ncbi:MAG: ABC transporter permease [Solirubrobacterales bacterium]
MSRAWAWFRHNAILLYAGLAIAYMLIPIAVIALFSFDQTTLGKLDFEWSGFTLEYWQDAFSNTSVNDSMITSIKLALITSIGATILGTMMALALVRYQFRGRKAGNLLIILPMATPEIVIGASLLSMFVYANVATGFTTLIIAHIMFSISFVVVVVRSRLIGFDRRLEEAAADLGASPWTTFRSITLPLIAPGVLAGGVLAFALSIDDFVISNFNAGTVETFPLYIYGASLRGIPVQVNVLATMLFAITIVAMIAVVVQQRRAEKMAEKRADDVGKPAALPL